MPARLARACRDGDHWAGAVLVTQPSCSSNTAGWSPRRVVLLVMHHAMGLSAAKSAALLGDVSRDAVIAKRRRLGLVSVQPPPAPPCRTQSGPRPRRARGAPTMRCEPLPDMAFPLPPGARPKPICDRSDGECAWPLGPAEAEGDYQTEFCCAPAQGRGPYCESHAALAKWRP